MLIEILPDTNPVMRKTSRRIQRVTPEIRKLVEDMYESMVENWGIGLAAVQVGELKRLFIYEIPQREVHGYETCRPDAEIVEKLDENGEDDNIIRIPDDPGYTGEYTVCINPRITSREGSFIDYEGCLSKVGWVAKVERAYEVTFQAYDLDMNKFERTVTGLEARCVQHEIDHMDGILFTDRAEPGSLIEISELEKKEAESGEDRDSSDIAAITHSEDGPLGAE